MIVFFALTSNRIEFPTKILMYKVFFKPTWTYSVQLWGSAKISNTNCIKRYQSDTLRTKAPNYVSKQTLHNLLRPRRSENLLQTLQLKPPKPFKSFSLASATIPGNPQKRLKRRWCRDLLS